MNEVSSSAFESVPEPAQPGRQLAAARERCGFTIADIAHQLKLSLSQVEAMEADDHQRLPGAVFVRGFIRNYARLVKLDPAPLLANTQQLPPVVTLPESELAHPVNIPFPSGHEIGWHKYAISALLVLAGLVMYEFYRDYTDEISLNSRPVALPQPELVAAEKGAHESAVQAVELTDVNAKPAPAVAATQTKTNAGDNPEPSGRTANVEQKAAEHLLKLRFDRESWVEIRDGYGRRIFSQLNPAGTELAVSGLPPLSLVVGNAVGVRLTHNDQPVDLAPHIKIDVARLTLE